MRKKFLFILYLFFCHLLFGQVHKWKHGYRTDRVVATRYIGQDTGMYQISFFFPNNPYVYSCETIPQSFYAQSCVRAREDINLFMIENDGLVTLEGPELFVAFKDVNSERSANGKMLKILPPLTRILKSFDKDFNPVGKKN